MPFYPRDIYPTLVEELQKDGVLVITGMRQVGKTTILKQLYELVESTNKVLLDLSNPLYQQIFTETNYDNVWHNLTDFGVTNSEPAFIFLDEVQNLPTIPQVAKYLYDHWSVKFVLTGSSSYYLKNLFSESMAGRKVVYTLYPLNFGEFLTFKNVKRQSFSTWDEKAEYGTKIRYERLIKYYQEYLRFGGFPRVVLEPDQDRKQVLLGEIFTSYFELDVSNLADFRNLTKLKDLILLLVGRVGSSLDVSRLALELDVSRDTVYSYLDFLEHTFFISLVSRYAKSLDKQVAGRKKVYLCDGGLAFYLGNIGQGELFEQSVYQNLRTKYQKISYWRDRSGEIDFIIQDKEDLVALEVKLTATKKYQVKLAKLAKKLKIKESYLISLNFSQLDNAIPAVEL